MTEQLYHYIRDENGDKWDCISDNIHEGRSATKKEAFDWCVKQSFEEGKPYLGGPSKSKRYYGFYLRDRKYDRYFSEGMHLEDYLSKEIQGRFSGKPTSGNEFSSGKFYSVASSSRLAVASFTEEKEGILDYIKSIIVNGEQVSVVNAEFEHDTHIEGIDEGSHSPQLDFFFQTHDQTDKKTYFIEVKNHEILDNHKLIKLSSSYMDTDAFKCLGLKGEPVKRKYVDSKGRVRQYISLIKDDDGKNHFILASDFGCDLKTFHFDFKQFLCHLMGIMSYHKEHEGEELYFYYLVYRNKKYEEYFDKELYEELESEIKKVFSIFSERFPFIDFGLCYTDQYNTLKELKKEELDG